MKQRFIVADVDLEACRSKPKFGRLLDLPRPGGPQRAVGSEGVRFVFAARDVRTLALLDAVWGGDAGAVLDGSDARIVCAPMGGMHGRYVDRVAGRQLLAFGYTPFTLIKQALRWEYGRQSPASGLMPLHGVILQAAGRCIAISARGQAGKSYLADTWLEADPTARVLVDDWSLVDPATRRIRRTGDAALHVRGSAFERTSAQLLGAQPVLVELCETDARSDETRYLVDRGELPRFDNDGGRHVLAAQVLVREPRAERFALRDDPGSVREAFEAETKTFWDDSLAGLPEPAVEYLREAWWQLLRSVPVVVMQGHRGVAAESVVEALREALEVGGAAKRSSRR